MSSELNFIFTLVFLGTITVICMKMFPSESSNYLPRNTKIMNYLGLGFLIFGAALNYTIGIDYATPFLIIALILNFKAIYNIRRDKNAIPSADQLRSHTIGISNNDPEIVNQIAKVAKARIMLFERPHPTNPLDTVRMIKCPKCRYLFELATSRIVGYTVYCPSCYRGTDLS